MKKSILLTSILALAACSFGGGGGHSGSGVAPREAITNTSSLTSNQEVTSMASEILVANGESPVVTRSGKVSQGGVTYTSYRLDDVKLYAAEASHTGNAYLQLGMDAEGRIDRVKMVIDGNGGDIARTGSEQFEGPIFEYVRDEIHTVENQTLVATEDARNNYRESQHWDDDGKWVQKNGKWQYVEFGDEAVIRVADTGQTKAQLDAKYKNLSGGHWNHIVEVMNVETYGADIDGNGTHLQYADFGHFNPVYRTKDLDLQSDGTYTKHKEHSNDEVNAELAEQDYQLFAGGYAISGTSMAANRPSLNPENNTTYKGTAIGRVYVSISGGGDGREAKLAAWNVPYDNVGGDGYTENAGHDMAKLYTTKEATMTIGADGTQTLYMPFNSESDTADTFYDVTIVKNANGTINAPVFEGTPNELQYVRNTEESNAEGDFNPGYYGVNTPSEAAGTARYRTKQNIGDGFKREWEVQAAYGMKKQN
jgi:hypothetical protein